jgi:hypothetical protein
LFYEHHKNALLAFVRKLYKPKRQSVCVRERAGEKGVLSESRKIKKAAVGSQAQRERYFYEL